MTLKKSTQLHYYAIYWPWNDSNPQHAVPMVYCFDDKADRDSRIRENPRAWELVSRARIAHRMEGAWKWGAWEAITPDIDAFPLDC
jgi:hypothetical protein